MNGPIKRSVTLNGHRTSVALEPAFWDALEQLAAARGQSMNALLATVDDARAAVALAGDAAPSLASALRLTALDAALAGEIAQSREKREEQDG